MAENILGLLLVSSTTRDRYVFRYPPDPTSPEGRLTQPVYSRATYTAKDSTVDHKSHRLFPRNRGAGDSRGSGSRGLNSASGNFWGSDASGRARNGGSVGSSAGPAGSTTSFHSHITEIGSARSDSSSSSDDSDFDRLFDGGVRRTHTPRRYSSDTDGSGPASVRPSAVRPFTEINAADGPRRGSLVESETTARIGGSKRGGSKAHTFVEEQYNYALGYSLDFLVDLLSPPRALCNRKFEVCVDELVFIGHPVCISSDGKWSYPSNDSDDEDEAERRSRGRRMNAAASGASAVSTPTATRDPSLRPLPEHPESPRSRFERLQDSTHSLTSLHRDALHRDALSHNSSSNNHSNMPSTAASLLNSTSTLDLAAAKAKKEDDSLTLNMFHLVLIVDKPDPRPEGGCHLADVFNHLYREIAFKWSAAAFALQVRDNWVEREVKELARMREKAIADGVPVVDFLRRCVEKSELAQSLHELFSVLHKMKGKPLNAHFSAMPTTVTINVGSIPMTIAIPPKQRNVEHGVRLGLGADSEISDDSDDEWAGVTGPDGLLLSRQPHLRVEPWQTLLMLQEDEDAIASMAAGRETVRRNSRSQQEEDELLAALIRACDITKPLHEIAHTLRYDLEGIVIPLARELVQSKRAVLVDVVNIRLRNILLPTSISDHLRSLTQHTARWNVLFPTLGPLVNFIAMISMSPQPFRDYLGTDAQNDPSLRTVYIRAVGWLLRNALVHQARVRARVYASAAVKEAAWRRIWHRRRDRWLRERAASMTSAGSGSARSRPSFGAAIGSVSAPVLPVTGASASAPSPKSELTTPRADTIPNPIDLALASRVPRLTNVPPTPMGFMRTATLESYADDSELGIDSDDGEDADGDGAGGCTPAFGEFSVDEAEPPSVPPFHASFIFHPAQAQKDEARWLRMIREHSADPVLRSRFDLCVQYFDGVTTFEEIMFHTSLSRRELDRIALVYRDDIMLTIQP